MDIIINKKPVSVPILPILATISVLVLGLMSVSVGSVGGNEIGIFVNNLTGKISVTLQTGSSVYNGLFTNFYTLGKEERTIKMEVAQNDAVRVKTGDGSDIELDVQINYKMIAAEKDIAVVAQECGLMKVPAYGANRRRGAELVDAYHEKWVRDYSRSIVRHVFGELSPKEFYNSTKRDQKADQARDELNTVLAPHGIEITNVVAVGYLYYKEYKELIDDKKAADQEVENQREEKITAQKDQERLVMEAEAVVKVRIAEMKGVLDKEFLSAQAEDAKARLGVEAEAYQKTTEADALFTKAQNESKGNFALASAEAEGLKKLAESLAGTGGINVVKLKYAEVLAGATISGVPYSTDPRIQKVELDAKNVSTGGK